MGASVKGLLVTMTMFIVSVTASTDTPYFLHLNCSNDTQEDHMDKAWVTIVPGEIQESSLSLYGQVHVCDDCTPLYLMEIESNKNCSFLVDTKFKVGFLVRKNTTDHPRDLIIKQWFINITEYRHYLLHINQDDYKVSISSDDLIHWDCNTPIYVGLGILCGVSLIWIVIRFLYTHGYFHRLVSCCRDGRQINTDLGTPSILTSDPDTPLDRRPIPSKPMKPRIRALDAFRGLSLTIMMFVNYGGGEYWFFRHSYWNGLTVADLVFPWFVWIMGTSIAISFHNLALKGTTKMTMFRKIIRRSVILFALGLLINTKGGPVDLKELRIPGVLQRLAFSYLSVAIIEFPMARSDDPHRFRWWSAVRELAPFWPQWIVASCFLALHLCLTFLLNVPGCGVGYLGPGGLANYSSHSKCTGGAAGYIDREVFGHKHIYQSPTCKKTYLTTMPYDPEGILGSLTSVVLCFLGLQAGKILLTHKDWIARTVRFLLWSFVLGGIAAALCLVSQNNGLIPVNKNLWSLSFVLAMGSMAFLLFTACYLLIDVFHIWSGTPFYFPGMNSILIYMCHEVFESYFPITWKAPNTHTVQLAIQTWGVTFWIILSAYLYYIQFFLTI